jgi:hypothetical protein
MCIEEAKKYSTRAEWMRNHPASYNVAKRNRFINESTSHMTGSKIQIPEGLVEKYLDKIYMKDRNGNTLLNLKTVKAIAIEAGLKKPDVKSSYDRVDNCISIDCEAYDFYGEPTSEIQSLYCFCKRIANNQNPDWRNL